MKKLIVALYLAALVVLGVCVNIITQAPPPEVYDIYVNGRSLYSECTGDCPYHCTPELKITDGEFSVPADFPPSL